ncbi:MAG: asparagine synthase (glutamine-hydrolyzing) [Candidatus Omnitrophica bacterium]|nr:asparagine synthase (glutamine-hydrolyzing) [Candidatus Omnitrophota bacterium]
MCGICGIKTTFSDKRDQYVEGMLDSLYYRGPDEKGVYHDDNISFGMRRLSIIDLKTGSQPIYNENKTVVVVCNGEIYNFQTLRDSLIQKGHHFYTDSDTEVLVHLYEEYGEKLFDLIKGMFSFAIWDKNKKTLLVARDRFGIKPLYYFDKNGTFAFASESKALLRLPFFSKELDNDALSLYFSLEYVPSPYSIWKDIHKLRPAHYILYKDGEADIRRYWDFKDNTTLRGNRRSIGSIREEFSELLARSVKEHLISDVPLGVFLSGGIDSSTLVALATQCSRQKLSTFSIGFEEKSFDESKYAYMVSRHFGTGHHSYEYTKSDFINDFHDVTSMLDEPFADLSIFPTYALSRFSRNSIKVALSGEGADELFMGYPTYPAHQYAGFLNRYLPRAKWAVKYLADRLPASFGYFSLDFKIKQFARGMYQQDPTARHMQWMGAFTSCELENLFSGKFRRRLAGKTSEDAFISIIASEAGAGSEFKKLQYIDIFTYLSEDLLVKSDRASMFSSLEVRVPYLDHELAEFIWGLDRSVIYQKKLLKNIMKGILPYSILHRPKKGFPIPFSLWMKDKKVFNTIKEFFDRDYIDRQGIFDPGYINNLLDEQLSGKKENRKKIRTYVMFQTWHKNWHY